ncbi:hypothetical protein JR316_0003128 [Psilocybe cubensis]|uniref:Uncharacterized protein n=2 Tax=Psilocybe cubensis TaxID=181762 RepID=A0ACB8H7A0_PSICU|nr:hypothetical protein JR316_0003128 [Psilocybe cubensis]KAH9483658.1 hypothetical protein JR316_0003128 [Psilocybe cubensis]
MSPPPRAKTTGPSLPESEPEDDDSDDEDYVPQPSARGNRKRADAPKSKGKKIKKILLLNLRNLSKVSLSILYEIFSYLSPLDLLNIARSNKANKAFLYSPERKSLWKAARRNFPGLPDCPADMTEPQYAFLAFGEECHVPECDTRLPKKLHTIWSGRTRLCTRCVRGRFGPAYINGKPRGSDSEFYSKLKPLLDLLPTVRMPNGNIYICVSTSNDWFFELKFFHHTNKKVWIETMVAKWSAIAEHAKACEAWEKQRLNAAHDSKLNPFNARVDAILDRLENMGWEAEVLDIRNTDDPNRRQAFCELPLIRKLCKRDLTEQIFKNKWAELEEYMKMYSSDMHIQRRQYILSSRIPHLNKIVTNYSATVPPTEVAPMVGDFFTNKDVFDFLLSTPNITGPADFAPLIARLPTLAQEVIARMHTKLLSVIAETAGKFAAAPQDKVLDLATTTFECNQCYEGWVYTAMPLRYPRVLTHNHTTHGHVSPWSLEPRQKEEADLDLLKDVIDVVPWNWHEVVTFDKDAANVLESVIQMCGLDPKTTTTKEMDELDPIIECLSCNNLTKGRMVMRWQLISFHHRGCHQKFSFAYPMEIRILEGEDAETIRARLNKEEELRRAAADYEGLACARCFKPGNTVTLRRPSAKVTKSPNALVRHLGTPKGPKAQMAFYID